MRIASLLPSATEILFAVGAGPEVVGVTHECDHPPAARGLPALTASTMIHEGQAAGAIDRHIRHAVHAGSSIYQLDETLLRELEPDLIVTQELCEVCAVAYTEVEQAARRLPGEVPVLSLEPLTLADISASVATVGRATGHAEGATRVVEAMRARIASAEALAPIERPPRVACIEWTEPLMVGGHWVPEMVRRAGGEDVLGTEMAPSSYVTWDAVVAARPDVMVLMPCGFNLQQTVALAGDVTGRPGFGDLPCARSGRLFAVDGSSYYNRPGPRIVDGLEIMARLLRARLDTELPAGSTRVVV